MSTPPKSSFKKLFIGTNLGKALVKMSEDKALPKGLKDGDVERGKIKRPPVPYVPIVDIVLDDFVKCTVLQSVFFPAL